MSVIEFDPLQTIPIVDALIEGPNGRRRVKLVFDTGCAVTQIDTELMETMGYTAHEINFRTEIQIVSSISDRCLTNFSIINLGDAAKVKTS